TALASPRGHPPRPERSMRASEGPLADITVLDLSSDIAGPYAAKLLADFGATVVKVEPPGGEAGRRRGPFAGLRPDRDAGGLFLALNTNKLGVTLALDSAAGRRLFGALLARADVLIE